MWYLSAPDCLSAAFVHLLVFVLLLGKTLRIHISAAKGVFEYQEGREPSDLIKHCPAVLSLHKPGYYFTFTLCFIFSKVEEREYILCVYKRLYLSGVQMEAWNIFHLSNALLMPSVFAVIMALYMRQAWN